VCGDIAKWGFRWTCDVANSASAAYVESYAYPMKRRYPAQLPHFQDRMTSLLLGNFAIAFSIAGRLNSVPQEGAVILIACTGHWTSHAMHTMQSFSLTGSDFFVDVGWPGLSIISKTFTGHTLTQISSALHMSWSTATIVP
jgi:hypothetical protein